MKKLLAALALFGWLTATANAAILFAGGEDSDYIQSGCSGACTINLTGTTFRAGYARESLQAGQGVGAWRTAIFTNSTTIWIHAQIFASAANNSAANGVFVGAFDTAGNRALVIRTNDTNSNTQVKISSVTSGGVSTDLVVCPNGWPINNEIHQFDWFINFANAGATTLYIDSVQKCTFSGNTLNGDGSTQLNQVSFLSPPPAATFNTLFNYSEGIVATTDTRPLSLWTLPPNGSGNTVAWTGANPCTAIINATTINTASSITSSVNNQIEECTVANTPPGGAFTILGLIMSANAAIGATGPQHFDFVTRTSGTDFFSADQSPTTTFGNISNYIQTVNPATTTSWTLSDFTAAGFNIGVESKP